MARCVYCNGAGRVSRDAQPGLKRHVSWGMADCQYCGGTGNAGSNSSATPRLKMHPVAWVFAIFGGIFGAALEQVGINVLVGALGGFIILGASASVLMRSRIGRRILIGIAVFFAVMLALGAYISGK